MDTIETKRLILRPFRESDYGDLFEFLYQLRDDEFEGYPGITYENGREHLNCCLHSEEFYAIEWKETGKVIGNISCMSRDYAAKEVGYIINAHFRQNIFFRRDKAGNPLWKDTYVYAMLNEERGESKP